ncbi:hypothetical protein I4F81_009184 [Pyropia yezoensis]|uniref:Uncharacterized protein n=1 Tax=Pyropia yezoensis TaxID=2788 RepID=A0ACC3C9W0_PYRYE|nr:hypothetical protein I4F81_009184 [Neopyropia yezoensis]
MREAGVAHARFDAYQLPSARSPRHAKGRDARFFRILARVSRWGVCSLPVVTPRRPSCRAVAAGAWPRRRRSSVRQALTDDTLAGGPRSPWVLAPPPPPFLALLPSFAPPPPPRPLLAPWTTPPPQGRPSSSAPRRRRASPTPFWGRPRWRTGFPRTACSGRGRLSTRWATTCWSTVATWSTRGSPRSSCFTATRVATWCTCRTGTTSGQTSRAGCASARRAATRRAPSSSSPPTSTRIRCRR